MVSKGCVDIFFSLFIITVVLPLNCNFVEGQVLNERVVSWTRVILAAKK